LGLDSLIVGMSLVEPSPLPFGKRLESRDNKNARKG
jgi:hypothetical protein